MFNKKAFTLIEMLVVVLIIGILAAIALPQYEIAVESSKVSEAVSNLSTIARAVDVYKLSVGQNTDNFDDLDVNIQGTKTSDTHLLTKYYDYHISKSSSNGTGYEVIATRSNTASQRYQYYIYINYYRGRSCTAKTQEARAICDKFCTTPTSVPAANGYYYCSLK